MRRLLWFIVCLMTMVTSANAQDMRIRALNEVKLHLLAPSKFVLTDIYGNRITPNQLKVKKNEKIIRNGIEYPFCYSVRIVGDAMNRSGGYEQIIKEVYFYNGEIYRSRPCLDDKREEENKVFDVVEQMPSFPGGQAALMQWISSNMKYPTIAAENGVQGRVIVQFVVEKDGSITNVHVTKSVDPSLDKEAVRLAKSMPKWIPGKQNGESVFCAYTIPVTFKMY